MPSPLFVTTPFAPLVTLVIAAPGFSKVSFPSTGTILAVSSAVVVLSLAMSATGASLISIVPVTGAPPSVVATVIVTVPLASATGTYVRPLRAAVMAADEPVNVTVPDPLPAMVTPEAANAVRLPDGTETVVVIDGLSTSSMTIWLPLAPLKITVVSSVPFCAAGSAWAGMLLTEMMVTVTVVVSVTPPDVTVYWNVSVP